TLYQLLTVRAAPHYQPMNKYVLFALLLSTLLNLDSCRRHHMTHGTGQTPTASSPTDSTVATLPTSTTFVDSTATPRPTRPDQSRPGIEEARTNVAEIDFRYLTAKSKISFKSRQQDIDNANVGIRVRKDSLI